MDPTTSKKPNDQNQYPNKLRISESTQPIQNISTSSWETGPASLQPSQEYMTTPTSSEIPHVSSSESGGIASLAINLQKEDLPELNTLLDEPLKSDLKAHNFECVITRIRVFFKKHVDLASKLEIAMANLHSANPNYEEVNSDEMSRSALLNTLSDTIKDPKVKTWKAVFSHQLFRLPPTEAKSSNPDGTDMSPTAHWTRRRRNEL
ncbi:hypothetical protein CPB86DRAFT_792395, partial [Serendipita vermifera]